MKPLQKARKVGIRKNLKAMCLMFVLKAVLVGFLGVDQSSTKSQVVRCSAFSCIRFFDSKGHYGAFTFIKSGYSPCI